MNNLSEQAAATPHQNSIRYIPLTQGKVAIVDASDFDWLSQWKWFAHNQDGLWYAHRNQWSDGKHSIVLMHRAIMDAPAGICVDHKNECGIDNRRSNLRLANKQKNSCNRGPNATNKSGYKGVFWDKNSRKWQAQICAHGKRIYLGTFADKQHAALAYDAAAKKHHGEFAHLNMRDS